MSGLEEQRRAELRDRVIAKGWSQGQHRTTCPWCSRDRKYKPKEPCMSVMVEPTRAMYQCYHCGEHGYIWLKDQGFNYRPRAAPQKAPTLGPAFTLAPPTPDDYAYLAGRKITKATVDKYQLCSATKYFRDLKRNEHAIGFPYRADPKAEWEAVKWRCKQKFWTQDGGARRFWGIEQMSGVFTDDDPLIITEGEIDTLTWAEVGYHNPLSVPNGAPLKVRDPNEPDNRYSAPNTDDRKYQFLYADKDMIDRASKIYIGADADPQGEALAEELARRIGRVKCWRIGYPEDCKDINDVLQRHGPEAVRQCLADATPFPVEGLFTVEAFREATLDLYLHGFPRGATIGIPEVDELVTFVPGMVTVVTGIPSDGKSTFVDFTTFRLALRHNWRFAVCSFETPSQMHLAKLAQMQTGKPFFAGQSPRMTELELSLAINWLRDRYFFVATEGGEPPTIHNVLERARIAVMRHGISGLVIDPYSRLVRGEDERDTDGIGMLLNEVQSFAKAHGVHVWFVAHPKKPSYPGDYVPGGYDISGSAHWFNHTDIGMTIRRPNKQSSEVEVHLWKVRWENWLGKKGVATIRYNVVDNRYYPENAYFNNGQTYSNPAPIGEVVGLAGQAARDWKSHDQQTRAAFLSTDIADLPPQFR